MCSDTIMALLATALTSIALAAGLVRAQTGCAPSASIYLIASCDVYLTSAAVLTPDSLCCNHLNAEQTAWGQPCYCEVLLQWSGASLGINMTKAYALPADCNVPADMSNCATTPPASGAVPPPALPSPPLLTPPSSLTPPSWLFTPPSGLTRTPPAGLTRTPPAGLTRIPPAGLARTPPTVPTFATTSSHASSSGRRTSLALPIGVGGGGLTGGGLIAGITWRVVRKRRARAAMLAPHSGRPAHYGVNGYGV